MAKTMIEESPYELTDRGYGKNNVKLLHVTRNGPVHVVKEVEVDTRLRLRSKIDYLHGDNSNIIATDSQKNTVYLLAREHGVESPEGFAMLLVSHFLYKYLDVDEVTVNVEEYPWKNIEAYNRPHNHAFIFTPTVTRFCTVFQKRNEPIRVKSGLKDLRVLKTTQSAFKNFVDDEYRTLPDADDRVFSTVVKANWDYSLSQGVDFDKNWHIVKDSILEKFAGPPDKGLFSPSVQNTLYLAEKMVLDKVPEVRRIEMEMPNKHYFNIDFSKFPRTVGQGPSNQEVYQPVDKPAGNIHAVLERKEESLLSKL